MANKGLKRVNAAMRERLKQQRVDRENRKLAELVRDDLLHIADARQHLKANGADDLVVVNPAHHLPEAVKKIMADNPTTAIVYLNQLHMPDGRVINLPPEPTFDMSNLEAKAAEFHTMLSRQYGRRRRRF